MLLYSENFDSGYTQNSTIGGVKGWTAQTGLVAPYAYAAPNVAPDSTGTVIGSATGSNPLAYNASYYSAGTLSSNSTVTLTMYAYDGTSSGVGLMGIGNTYAYYSGYGGTGAQSALFGFYGGDWAVRAASQGTISNPVNSSGAVVTPVLGDWYQVQSVWNLAASTMTLSIKNLTAGDTSFTTLYFNAAQTQTTEPLYLGSTSGVSTTDLPSNWNSVYVRMTFANNPADYLDNFNVTYVPEPSAFWCVGVILLSAGFGRKLLRRNAAPSV